MAGYDVTEAPLEAKRRTGYLPETPPVYPDMTVAEYLAFVARIKGVSRRDIKTRSDEIIEKMRGGGSAQSGRSGNYPRVTGSA